MCRGRSEGSGQRGRKFPAAKKRLNGKVIHCSATSPCQRGLTAPLDPRFQRRAALENPGQRTASFEPASGAKPPTPRHARGGPCGLPPRPTVRRLDAGLVADGHQELPPLEPAPGKLPLPPKAVLPCPALLPPPTFFRVTQGKNE